MAAVSPCRRRRVPVSLLLHVVTAVTPIIVMTIAATLAVHVVARFKSAPSLGIKHGRAWYGTHFELACSHELTLFKCQGPRRRAPRAGELDRALKLQHVRLSRGLSPLPLSSEHDEALHRHGGGGRDLKDSVLCVSAAAGPWLVKVDEELAVPCSFFVQFGPTATTMLRVTMVHAQHGGAGAAPLHGMSWAVGLTMDAVSIINANSRDCTQQCARAALQR